MPSPLSIVQSTSAVDLASATDAACCHIVANANSVGQHAAAAFWNSPLRLQLLRMAVSEYDRMGEYVEVLRAELAADAQ